MVAQFPAFTWSSPLTELAAVFGAAFVVLAAVIAFIRVVGLRSLSKMSGFDFAVTVAIGSVLGSGVASSTPVAQAVVAIGALLSAQWLVAQLRVRVNASRLVDNEPLLLVRDGRFLADAMTQARVLESDVLAKLRHANVGSLSHVRAVVLETTGDMSIMHGDERIADDLLADVRGHVPAPAEQ